MKCYGATDVGRQREINEDFFLLDEEKGIFIVADGLGGYQAGEVASAMATKKLHEALISNQGETLETIYQNVNSALRKHAKQNESCQGMGTTVVFAKVEDEMLLYSNIGDSRMYGVNKEKIHQLTTDHSLVEELKERGIELQEEEITSKRNIITSALGVDDDFKFFVYEMPKENYDYYLLCTDGLTNMLKDEEIFKVFTQGKDLKEKCNQLIEKANEQGGSDNITVIGLEI